MSIRIDLGPEARLGPGKVLLLERIAEHGSISAAGRSLAMSYKRAWDLVAELNDLFASPLVTAQTGGRRGGGATLTDLGLSLVAHYRAIEREAEAAVRTHLAAFDAACAPVPAVEAGRAPGQGRVRPP